MATAPRERLLPSLLDRLIDEAPRERAESRQRRAFSMADLKRAVRRDLEWLLNTVSLEAVTPLDAEPAVRDSVINFGLPALAGITPNHAGRAAVQKRLREAILAFEPRILADTLRIVLERDEEGPDEPADGSLVFRIEGMLWGQPLPEALYLRTEVDLDRGRVSVAEA